MPCQLPENPLVSVIVPVYNAAQYVHKCLDSILEQTYTNLDIVLVDDGSTDGCAEILDDYAARDARIQVIHQPNGGVSAARNTGLDAARGDCIAWLDSDDYFLPGLIEKLLRAMQRHGKKIAMCNYALDRRDGNINPRYTLKTPERECTREEMVGFILGLKVMPILWANLMTRDLYAGIRFPVGKLFEDVRTTYKLHERADGCVFLSEVLLLRNDPPKSLSRNPNIKNRVDACYAYMERRADAVQRWPQYDQDMLVAAARHLRILRSNVMRNPARLYRENAADIRRICAYYRGYTSTILPKSAGPIRRLHYWLITSGSRPGFWLSWMMDAPRFFFKKKGLIELLTPPNLPSFNDSATSL